MIIYYLIEDDTRTGHPRCNILGQLLIPHLSSMTNVISATISGLKNPQSKKYGSISFRLVRKLLKMTRTPVWATGALGV